MVAERDDNKRDDNPYLAPEYLDQEFNESPQQQRQPFGISFIAGLMMLAAVGMVLNWISMWRQADAALRAEMIHKFGLVRILLIAPIYLWSAIFLAAGRRWGWIGATFVLLQSGLHYAFSLAFLAWDLPDEHAALVCGQIIVRGCMAAAALVYLLRGNVLRYYSITHQRLPWILGAAATLAAILAFLPVSRW